MKHVCKCLQEADVVFLTRQRWRPETVLPGACHLGAALPQASQLGVALPGASQLVTALPGAALAGGALLRGDEGKHV